MLITELSVRESNTVLFLCYLTDALALLLAASNLSVVNVFIS